MANGYLCTNKLITDSGITFSHTAEISGYEAEQVQVYQPGESFRTSVLTPGYIQAQPLTFPVDTLAALYTNVTPHRNMLYQSNEFDESVWETVNATPSKDVFDSAAPEANYAWTLTDDATAAEHSIAQELDFTADELPAIPADSDWTTNYFNATYYVSRPSGTLDVHLRLQTFSTEYIGYSFDLDAGTVGSEVSSGTDWSNGAASIFPIDAILGSDTWYRIKVRARCSSGSRNSLTSKLLLESSGSLSYSGSGESINAQAATMENGTTESTWVPTTTDHAAFVRYSNSTAPLIGWQHAVAADRRTEPFIHLIRKSDTAVAVEYPRIEIFDDGNADGYIEIGNVVVGRSFQPSYNLANGWNIGWAEEGNSARAPGGQLYRAINKRYRQISMSHHWLTEDEALAESFEIDRMIGQSQGVMVSVDPASEYVQQLTIWGLQDAISPTLHRRYVKAFAGEVYAKEWNVIEALP